MKKSMIIVSLIMVLAFLLSACAPSAMPVATEVEPIATEAPTEIMTAAPETVELLVWDQFTEEDINPVAEDLYAMFMEQNPDIKIVREVYTIDQIATTARTALASATGPDVAYFDIAPTKELIGAGLIAPLDDFAKQFGWDDRFYSAGLSWTTQEGKLYGLGLESEFVGIFYNQSIFDKEGWEVPQTFSEALEFCKTAKAAGYLPMAHSQNPGWQTFFSFTMPVHNYVGVNYMEELLFNGKGSWNTPEMVAAVATVSQDMKNAGCFADDLNGLDYDTATSMFINREAVMFPTGTWIIGRANELDETDDVRMMPWFDMETGNPRVYTLGMGSAWYISANSAKKEAAARLLDFLFSEEVAKIWVEKGNRIPPVPVDTSALEIAPLTKFAVDTLGEAGAGSGDVQLGWNVDLIVPQAFNEMMIAGFQGTFAGDKTDQAQMDDLQKIWEAR